MHKKYNVIIAGAGPAGLMAAIRSARKGLKVLLVEKKATLREALRTTGNAFRIKNPVHGEYLTLDKKNGKATIHFHNSNFDVDYTGPLIDMYDAYFFSNAGYRLHTTRKDRPLSSVYSMSVLLGNLQDTAEDAGVECMTGTLALSAENADNHIRLQVRRGNTVSWLEADYVIAADGLNSRLAETMGMTGTVRLFYRVPVLKPFLKVFTSPTLPALHLFWERTCSGAVDSSLYTHTPKGKAVFV